MHPYRAVPVIYWVCDPWNHGSHLEVLFFWKLTRFSCVWLSDFLASLSRIAHRKHTEWTRFLNDGCMVPASSGNKHHLASGLSERHHCLTKKQTRSAALSRPVWTSKNVDCKRMKPNKLRRLLQTLHPNHAKEPLEIQRKRGKCCHNPPALWMLLHYFITVNYKLVKMGVVSWIM